MNRFGKCIAALLANAGVWWALIIGGPVKITATEWRALYLLLVGPVLVFIIRNDPNAEPPAFPPIDPAVGE